LFEKLKESKQKERTGVKQTGHAALIQVLATVPFKHFRHIFSVHARDPDPNPL